ncbi:MULTISPECIES: hypothetical protein [Eubacteriales]|uniref:hypothetical protein n=1 Tax=Eubacteriales TaxID=186802 RepID=UPI001106D19D|nr:MULTISPECIES: hypothetical protein [Eubacteriales]
MIDFKSTVYWKIYGDVFAFHKKFAEVQESDEYWSAVVDEASALYKRYESVPEKEFAKQLILTVLDELERIYKNMPKKHE